LQEPIRRGFSPVHSGSYGLVVPAAPIALPDPYTIVVPRSAVAARWAAADRARYRRRIDTVGCGRGCAAGIANGGHCQVTAQCSNAAGTELRVTASAGRLRLRQTALQRSWGVADSGAADMAGTVGAIGRLAFGAGFTTNPGLP